MTISESFAELIRRIQPLESELEAARQHLATIQVRLETVFAVSNCRTIGSFARDTSIRGFSDTDLIGVFRKTEFTWGGEFINSNTALDNVRRALLARYPNSDIRRDGIAIAIRFTDGRQVDVVPAMFDRMHRDKWPVYLIPDGNGWWMSTSPSLYDAYIAGANSEAGGKLIAVAQLMKFWRECRDPRIPLSSFHIEMVLASEESCKGVKSYAECTLDILRSLARRECRAMRDPYDIAGNIPAVKTDSQRERALASVINSRNHAASALSASGTNGQFRTPRHIIDLIVELVNPKPGQRICDPACGTAGFLISAFTHILRENTKAADLKRGQIDGALLKPAQWKFLEEQAFTGFDNDANMVKIAILNLYLHQLERAKIDHFNPLTTGFGGLYPGQRFDTILANPPFAGKVQDESILADLNYKLDTRATELLFLKWFIDHLTDNGRAGVIVPNGVLFAGTNAATKLREILLTECDLQAVISLPSGVFKPYAGVATAALIFQKGCPTKSVWFYDLTADGFSLDDKRSPIVANDIPDALTKWPNRDEGPNSYRVSVEKIKENDWSLAAGRYKPVTTVAANHDAPADILREILKVESEITRRGNTLLSKISGKQ